MWPVRWTVYEPFGFKDGTRCAWVTYEIADAFSERRCVHVSEAMTREEAEKAADEASAVERAEDRETRRRHRESAPVVVTGPRYDPGAKQ